MGRLAAENSSNADVKQFGQRMVDDHTKGLDELDKAANKAGFTPAQAMDAKDRDLFMKLSSLKGADFDKAYVPSQVADHKEAIGLFEAESKSGKNDDLKAIAGKMVADAPAPPGDGAEAPRRRRGDQARKDQHGQGQAQQGQVRAAKTSIDQPAAPAPRAGVVSFPRSLVPSFPNSVWERRPRSSASRPVQGPDAKRSFAISRSQTEFGNEGQPLTPPATVCA